MKTQDEIELLEGAKAFYMQALAAIYDRCSPGLYTYAMRLLGDPCLVEECVSETFSCFLKGLCAGNGPSTYLQAYLYRVAHNWITDMYCHQLPPSVELDENLQAENAAQLGVQIDQRHMQDTFRTALRTLTPDQRQVFLLRYIEDWENDEVAVALRRWLIQREKEEDYAFDRGS